MESGGHGASWEQRLRVQTAARCLAFPCLGFPVCRKETGRAWGSHRADPASNLLCQRRWWPQRARATTVTGRGQNQDKMWSMEGGPAPQKDMRPHRVPLPPLCCGRTPVTEHEPVPMRPSLTAVTSGPPVAGMWQFRQTDDGVNPHCPGILRPTRQLRPSDLPLSLQGRGVEMAPCVAFPEERLSGGDGHRSFLHVFPWPDGPSLVGGEPDSVAWPDGSPSGRRPQRDVSAAPESRRLRAQAVGRPWGRSFLSNPIPFQITDTLSPDGVCGGPSWSPCCKCFLGRVPRVLFLCGVGALPTDVGSVTRSRRPRRRSALSRWRCWQRGFERGLSPSIWPLLSNRVGLRGTPPSLSL